MNEQKMHAYSAKKNKIFGTPTQMSLTGVLLLTIILSCVVVVLSGCSGKKDDVKPDRSGDVAAVAVNPSTGEVTGSLSDDPELQALLESGIFEIVDDEDDTEDEEEEELLPEGYMGTADMDGTDCPLFCLDDMSYVLVGDEAWVVFTVFTDTYLENYYIRDAVEYEGKSYPVTVIDEQAFAYCESMTSVRIPNSVKRIAVSAFDGCGALTSLVIPEGVEEIGDYCFNECKELSTVVLPKSLKKMGDGLFFNCSALTTVMLPDGLTKIPDDTFSGCESLRSVSIPDSVTDIGAEAFWYCEALESIKLPDSLLVIEPGVFYDCMSLTEITLPGSLAYIDDDVFDYCDSLTVLRVPAAKLEEYQEQFAGYEFEVVGY